MDARPLFVTLSVLILSLAGCMDADDEDGGSGDGGTYNQDTGLFEEELETFQVAFAPGALSTIASDDGSSVSFPEGTVVLDGERWVPASTHDVAAGATLSFLPPPGDMDLVLGVDGTDHTFQADAEQDHARFLDGDRIVEWLRVWNDEYPDHNPGTQSYIDAGNWAKTHLEGWGYDVVYDEYGSTDAPQTVCPPVPVSGQQACPASFANVVATKPGSDDMAGTVIIGGHYDIVPQITHGAYDNTGGTLTVMELARALSPYSFDQTLVFALWGGEESGTLGSSSWVASHPEARAEANVYWNLDVVGNSWPAPLNGPTSLHIQYGPDSGDDSSPDPVEENMQAWAMRLVEATHYPEDAFDYAGAVEDQATSDHIAFMAEGIPVYLPNSMPEASRVTRLHTETDTLTNMSKYALWGVDTDTEESGWVDEETRLHGEDVLARSFDPYLWLIFQHVVLSEQEGFDPYASS